MSHRLILIKLLLLFVICSHRTYMQDPWFCGNGICESYADECPESCPDDCVIQPVIRDAWIEDGPWIPIPSHGDLWISSWADDSTPDGRLVMTWGDGCGPGISWGEPACDEWNWDTDITDMGFFMANGTVPDIQCIEEGETCFTYRSVPDDIPGFPHSPFDDKPASIISLDGTVYLAVYSPQKIIEKGYLATSNDWGHTWNIIPDSPWTMENPTSPNSPFRLIMFFQMGKNYAYNTDGYVYALGIGWGYSWDFIGDSRVFLCRVPRAHVADYEAYEYYAGMNESFPEWTSDQMASIPLDTLYLNATVNPVYHPYLQRFLLISDIGVYEAPNPWGPWIMSGRIIRMGTHPDFFEAYSNMLIPKDMGPDYVYLITTGRSETTPYSLNIARLQFQLNDAEVIDHSIPKPWQPVPVPMPRAVTVDQKRAYSQVNTSKPGPSARADEPSVIRLQPGSDITIQNAIDTVSDCGTIILAPGIYRGHGNTDVVITRPVRLFGDGMPGTVVIDGEDRRGGLYIRDVGEPGVSLDNLLFQDCFRIAPGGALTVIFSQVFMHDVSIERCRSQGTGGGLGMYESNVTWINGHVHGCYTGIMGGGIANYWQGHLHCQGVEFLNNHSHLYGGSYYDYEAHSVFSDCQFMNSTSLFGGAIGCHQACTMQFENCFFESNSAGVHGGAIYYLISDWHLCDSNAFRCLHGTFRNNTAGWVLESGKGGAVFSAFSPENTLIRDSIFWDNTANTGHQIAFDGTGYIEFQHSLVQGGYNGVYRNGLDNWVLWGDGMLTVNPLFTSGLFGDSYLSQIASGHSVDSPALNAGHASANSIVYGIPNGPLYTMSSRTTSIHHVSDSGLADMGAHYKTLEPVPLTRLPHLLIMLGIISVFIIRKLK